MICEAFQCPPDVAQRQDPVLCEQIMTMRNYAGWVSMEQQNPKMLSEEQRRWLIRMEKTYGAE